LASSDDDRAEDDDARELFVAAWCLHPLLVPEQKLLVIPEPPEPHDLGILFLWDHEIVRSHLPICPDARRRVSGLGRFVQLVG
jgi:hypothetical protein